MIKNFGFYDYLLGSFVLFIFVGFLHSILNIPEDSCYTNIGIVSNVKRSSVTDAWAGLQHSTEVTLTTGRNILFNDSREMFLGKPLYTYTSYDGQKFTQHMNGTLCGE